MPINQRHKEGNWAKIMCMCTIHEQKNSKDGIWDTFRNKGRFCISKFNPEVKFAYFFVVLTVRFVVSEIVRKRDCPSFTLKNPKVGQPLSRWQICVKGYIEVSTLNWPNISYNIHCQEYTLLLKRTQNKGYRSIFLRVVVQKGFFIPKGFYSVGPSLSPRHCVYALTWNYLAALGLALCAQPRAFGARCRG